MKQINPYYWKLYKESKEGKLTISDFEKMLDKRTSNNEILAIIKKYNPDNALNEDYFDVMVPEVFRLYNAWFNGKNAPTDYISARQYAIDFIDFLALRYRYERQPYREIIPFIIPMSICLYRTYPEYYIPYLYVLRYEYLQWIFDEYDVEVASMPAKFDYPKRNAFYLDICDALCSLIDNMQMSGSERAAFLYGFSYEVSKEDLKNYPNANPRVWLIGGCFNPDEKQSGLMRWECNAETRKGDIMLFFETSKTLDKKKRSCLTSIWRAASDGVRDPFFYFHETAYIDEKIDIPLLSFNILYNDPIVGQNPKIKQLCNGLSGTEVKPSEYAQIIELIKVADPSFDISQLPKFIMYAPIKDADIKEEADVENKLILELLKQLKLRNDDEIKSGRYFRRQVPLRLGREKTEAKGRTDFSLYPFGEDKIYADVLIETKHGRRELRNEAEVKVAFKQAESYAAHQYAGLMMLIDEHFIRLYYRGKDGVFQYTPNPEKFEWDILTDNKDGFNKLQKIIYSFNVHKTH